MDSPDTAKKPVAVTRREVSFVLNPELAASINQIVRTVAEGHAKLKPALEEMVRMVLPVAQAIQTTVASIGPMIAHVQDELQKAAPMLLAILEAIERMPARTAHALRIFAQNGWYLDPEMFPSDIFRWAIRLEEGQVEAVHQELIAHFRESLDGIEQRLGAAVPSRARFFQSAINAHRRGDYAASIPLLLAQADGLCFDVTKVQLYSRAKGRMKIEAFVKGSVKSELSVSVLTALIEPLPISASENERKGLTNYLNRHEVLHGESVTYDTELNSCRAISLVVYVVWAMAQESLKPAVQAVPSESGG